MDFVSGFPKTTKGNDSIWVIVDKLTKSTHFLPMKINHSMQKLTEMYIEEIVRLHGIPSSIMSDKDMSFTSKFWEGLHNSFGTNLRFSSVYHLEMNASMKFRYYPLEVGGLETCLIKSNRVLEDLKSLATLNRS